VELDASKPGAAGVDLFLRLHPLSAIVLSPAAELANYRAPLSLELLM
jgi:hypothetical protein